MITLYGSNLSPTNLATSQIPVPTALANSCITVNGQPIPLIFVSPTQINAQMPFQAVGAETIVVHTPGGTSDNFNLIVQPTAPAVFLSGVAGPQTNLPTVIRARQRIAGDRFESDPSERRAGDLCHRPRPDESRRFDRISGAGQSARQRADCHRPLPSAA